MAFDWTQALTPKDTSAWASQLPGQKGLTRVPLRNLDFNRVGVKLTDAQVAAYELTPNAQAFRWNDGDNETPLWIPQGICGIRLNNPRLSMIVASLYHKGDPTTGVKKGARVSFANVTPDDPKRFHYRHVLLVERDGEHGFKPVRIHAAGLGYSNGYLFVPDTDQGIRVFDTSLLMGGLKADESKSRCGFVGNEAYAYDYRYILPQVYFYDGLYQALKDSELAKASGNAPKFSYLSMEWSVSPPRILTGSYIKSETLEAGQSPSAFLWQLSARLPGRLDPQSNPRNLNIPVNYKRFRWIQGAAIYGSKFYISRSAGQGIKLHTLNGTWQDNNYAVDLTQTHFAGNALIAHEDLHMSLNSDLLWGLSEKVGDKIVFWLRGVK